MNIAGVLRSGVKALGTLFYPPHCAQCEAAIESGYLCATCRGAARRIHSPFCAKCSQPFSGEIDGAFTCSNCANRELHFDFAVSHWRSVGVVRDLVHRFKYRGEFYLRHPLTDWLASAMEDSRVIDAAPEWLVPVPLHATRYREREFNQSEALARLLSARTGLPLVPCLKRIRYTTTQTQLDREERMENLRNAFIVRHNTDLTNRRIMLIDDVLTTGSTVNECARVLRRAGAASVCVATVARG